MAGWSGGAPRTGEESSGAWSACRRRICANRGGGNTGVAGRFVERGRGGLPAIGPAREIIDGVRWQRGRVFEAGAGGSARGAGIEGNAESGRTEAREARLRRLGSGETEITAQLEADEFLHLPEADRDAEMAQYLKVGKFSRFLPQGDGE